MSTEAPTTFVTREMIDSKGKFGYEQVSPPISASDIRKWAIAVYWSETPPRIYWDEAYAKTTRYGDIIAPLEFNPFAWPVHRPTPPPGRTTPQGAGVGSRGMNGGQTEEYFVPMRPGDVITSTIGLVEWNERQTRLGLTLFMIRETRWTNQDGELVKVKRGTSIRY